MSTYLGSFKRNPGSLGCDHDLVFLCLECVSWRGGKKVGGADMAGSGVLVLDLSESSGANER